MATKKTSAKRASQDTQPPPFVIRRSSIQGKGAFSLRKLAKGERLIEYVGERISTSEATRRYDDTKMRRHHTFLFNVSSRTVIDGDRLGNDARYFNHSCAPNCETEVVRGRVYILTRRAIKEGEELTYDYNYELDGPIEEDTLRTYACHCGAPRCRGTILGAEARARAPRAALRRIRMK